VWGDWIWVGGVEIVGMGGGGGRVGCYQGLKGWTGAPTEANTATPAATTSKAAGPPVGQGSSQPLQGPGLRLQPELVEGAVQERGLAQRVKLEHARQLPAVHHAVVGEVGGCRFGVVLVLSGYFERRRVQRSML